MTNSKSPSIRSALFSGSRQPGVMPSGIGAVLLSSAAFLLPPGSLHAQSTSAGATQLQQITVTEENANGPVNGIVAKKTATAGKTGRPILKTPQTVNVVGRDELRP